MNLKSLLSRLAVSRLDRQARVARRALRDHQRSELTRIRDLEIRARGLRLYVAWSRRPASLQPRLEVWQPLGTPALTA
jgi:hypothetical protein